MAGIAAELERQRIDRERHRLHRCPIDVERIDLIRLDDADAEDGARLDERAEAGAFGGRELLGIIDAARRALGGQHHRSGDDRPAEGAAPRLVHPGDGGRQAFSCFSPGMRGAMAGSGVFASGVETERIAGGS